MFFLSQNTVTGQSFAFDVEGPGAAKGSAALRGRLRTWPTDWDGDGDVTSWVGQIRPKSPEKSPRFFHMKSTFFYGPCRFPWVGYEQWAMKVEKRNPYYPPVIQHSSMETMDHLVRWFMIIDLLTSNIYPSQVAPNTPGKRELKLPLEVTNSRTQTTTHFDDVFSPRCSTSRPLEGARHPMISSHFHITGWWLSHPSEKWWSSSVGIMTFPIWWKQGGPENPKARRHTARLFLKILGCGQLCSARNRRKIFT